jgi:hypothetical protein
MLHSLLLAATVAIAAPAEFPDPDGVMRPIDSGLVTIVVPAGKIGQTDCTYDAGFENAVIIYSDDPTPVELMRCGNTSNDVRHYPLTMPAGTYYVTAWHKEGYVGESDLSTKRWTTSIAKGEALSPQSRNVLVEDGIDNDFNDVIVRIRLNLPTLAEEEMAPGLGPGATRKVRDSRRGRGERGSRGALFPTRRRNRSPSPACPRQRAVCRRR